MSFTYKESRRPRRHVLAANFFEHVNFAYDETKHATRILQPILVSSCESCVEYDLLHSTKHILGKCVKKDDAAYKVVAEAILDIRSLAHKDWWTIASDICCVFDKTTNRLFYIPVSAINAQFKQHTIASLDLLNCSCLAQLWVRSPEDLVCDCSMSYTTHQSDVNGKYCAFSLGNTCTQDDINANSMASKHLNLSFMMIVPGIETSISETAQGRITTCSIDNHYDNEQIEVQLIAFNYATGKQCLDAFGELDLLYDNCSISSTRVIMKHGFAKFYIRPFAQSDESSDQLARVILSLHGSTPARLHCTFRI